MFYPLKGRMDQILKWNLGFGKFHTSSKKVPHIRIKFPKVPQTRIGPYINVLKKVGSSSSPPLVCYICNIYFPTGGLDSTSCLNSGVTFVTRKVLLAEMLLHLETYQVLHTTSPFLGECGACTVLKNT